MSDMMLERSCRVDHNARCSQVSDWVESGTGGGQEGQWSYSVLWLSGMCRPKCDVAQWCNVGH